GAGPVASTRQEQRQGKERPANRRHGEPHHGGVTTSSTLVGYGASELTRRSCSLSASGTRVIPKRKVSPTSQAALPARAQAGLSTSTPIMKAPSPLGEPGGA